MFLLRYFAALLVCAVGASAAQYNGIEISTPADVALHRRAPATPGLAILRLAERPDAAVRAAWDKDGLHLLRYIPDQAWLVRIDPEARVAATMAGRPYTLRALDAELRVNDSIFRYSDCGDLPLYVHLAPGSNADAVIAHLTQAGFPGAVAAGTPEDRVLALRTEQERCFDIAALTGDHPDVTLVERGTGAKLFDNRTQRIIQSGSSSGPHPMYTWGIYGAGQIIGICDTGIDADMCYYRDPVLPLPPVNTNFGTQVDLAQRKVIAVNFLDPNDDPSNIRDWDDLSLPHGTLVAGHAAGSDLSAPLGTNEQNGIALLAQLVIQDGGTGTDDCADLPALGCPVTNFLAVLEQAYAQGVRIHNNSWGDNENGTLGALNGYTPTCREVDWMTWSNKDFLVVCAAGNGGSGNDTVSSPSTAKNALSVGATGNDNLAALSIPITDVASFSARGWADDGRIKPDVIAPGQVVASSRGDGRVTTSNCTFSGFSGTSFSAPNVAGAAALARDYLAQGFYPGGVAASPDAWVNPSAALIKGMIIHAAEDMSGAAARPPARDQGWGRVNLQNVLRVKTDPYELLLAEDAGFADTVATPWRAYLMVTDTNTPIEITLCWSDYPSAPAASKHLVNDLDLRLNTPGGSYRGNTFASHWSVAGGDGDHTNNVERVRWMPTSTGLVEISVAPYLIAQGAQDFALVATGVFDIWAADRDEDADLLPDVWEHLNFGGLGQAFTNDVDGDGLEHGGEFAAGTDPLDPDSVLIVTSVAASTNAVDIAWASVTGILYRIWADSNVAFATPALVASNLPATPPRNTQTVAPPTPEHIFYRVGTGSATP